MLNNYKHLLPICKVSQTFPLRIPCTQRLTWRSVIGKNWLIRHNKKAGEPVLRSAYVCRCYNPIPLRFPRVLLHLPLFLPCLCVALAFDVALIAMGKWPRRNPKGNQTNIHIYTAQHANRPWPIYINRIVMAPSILTTLLLHRQPTPTPPPPPPHCLPSLLPSPTNISDRSHGRQRRYTESCSNNKSHPPPPPPPFVSLLLLCLCV